MIRILLFAASLLFAPLGHAAYTSMYVFGDSLSDNGNAYALSGGSWPASPPYAGRFSDGPTAAERLAGRLGIDLQPSAAGGTNFAVGGATTGTQNYNYEISSPQPLPPALGQSGTLAQVAGFVGGAPAFDPASSLFMLWAAPNDFFLALGTGTDLAAAARTAVSNLITSIGLLTGAGATDILVPNMPNLSRTPFGLSLNLQQQAALDVLSRSFNEALAGTLDLARSGSVPGIPGGLRLMSFDTAAAFDEIISDPGAFGFTDVTTPCIFSPAGCEGALFLDGVHPTTTGHRLLADRFLAALAVPEPPTAALLLAALAGVLLVRRRSQ
ncbi:SGNH/GDSL hydrolase family protein [Thauera sp.]|uniref:SGNH/GDSL hydrolase family protein n=1 Tax=Thauera sp. TaxID=1905334 RepID=UPI0039E5C4A5